MTLSYDRVGDILHIDFGPRRPDQETEFLGDDIVARLNPETGAIESIEVLGLTSRAPGAIIPVPVTGSLAVAE
ncbi:MAG: DUF2283 domain-containing protein [Dehalococcoidia bacterium]